MTKRAWHCNLALLLAYTVERARTADLVIVGRHGPGDGDPGPMGVSPGALLMEAGRPVLVASPGLERLVPKRVVIAWKDTREARRAVHDALPLIAGAERVCVVAAGPDAHHGGAEATAQYLSGHGIAATTHLLRAKGESAFGMRPLAVGRSVLREMQVREVRRLRRAMRRADGRDATDDWYCALGNVGYGVPQAEGEPVTPEDVALMLEYLGMARVEPQTDKSAWQRILNGAFGSGSVPIVSRIYARATGLEDEILFHPVIGDEMRERLRAQRQVLVASGFLAPVAYARPALHRYPPDAPELREPEQMPLFGGYRGRSP